ncbi:Rubredoxin family protein [Citrus sinensis]|uniref:Rubredoxin family protein n=1 Tax=Citrus sinensis TaxID=2711 RepID=A0ACB8JR61_CITSI|nr:Rubredoxin family protein [Citrus sinensis]
MSSAVVAGASIKISPRRRAFSYSHTQKTTLQGLSLQESKRRVSDHFLAVSKTKNATRSLDNNKITARTAGASKTIEVEVDKPLGLTLGQKPGGGVVITAVEGGGNAAKAGLKSGDQVLYTSSFFGDELWPADKLGFTKTAIQAKPDSVYFVVNRGGADVDVKRLPKRPAPPRFDTYVCPQCQAPKKRFARYDVNAGKPIGSGLPPIGVIIGLIAGIGAVGALLVYGLQ